MISVRTVVVGAALAVNGCALDIAQELEDKYDSITCGGIDVKTYEKSVAVTYRLEVISEDDDAWLTPAGKCEPTLCYEAAPGETVHVMNNSSQYELIRWKVLIDSHNTPCD